MSKEGTDEQITSSQLLLNIPPLLPAIDQNLDSIRQGLEEQGFVVDVYWDVTADTPAEMRTRLNFTRRETSPVPHAIFSASNEGIVIHIVPRLEEDVQNEELDRKLAGGRPFRMTLDLPLRDELLRPRRRLARTVLRCQQHGSAAYARPEPGVFIACIPTGEPLEQATERLEREAGIRDLWLPSTLTIGKDKDLAIERPYTCWLWPKARRLVKEGKVIAMVFVNISELVRLVRKEAEQRKCSVDPFDESTAIMDGLTVQTPNAASRFYIQNIVRSVMFEGHSLSTAIALKCQIFDRL